MINIFVHEISTRQVNRLLQTARSRLKNIRLITYQSAFRRLYFPAGTLVFTDFDYLNVIETETVANMALAAEREEPAVRILNHPIGVCERYQLMKRLSRSGISEVMVSRLDDEEMPRRFPVFIRAEDGWWGPDTDIIDNEAQYRQALASLGKQGKPVKRRICVSFEAERDGDGYFRKYGAFRVGDQIIPQHILRNRGWMVKSDGSSFDEIFATEEVDYIRDNPDRELLMSAFKAGGIEFGRIDYSFKQGRLVVFEINTNPTFPRFVGGVPGREERRGIILERLVEAFDAIQSPPSASKACIKFNPPLSGHRWMQSHRWGLATRLAWRMKLAWRGVRFHGNSKPNQEAGNV